MTYTLEFADVPAQVADARDAYQVVVERNEVDFDKTSDRYHRLVEPSTFDLNAAGMGLVRRHHARTRHGVRGVELRGVRARLARMGRSER